MNPRTQHQAIIPMHPEWARLIYTGEKTIEIRRKRPRSNTRLLWLYETRPTSMITGTAKLIHVHADSPQGIWHRYGPDSHIDRDEYDRYTMGTTTIYALRIDQAQQLDQPLPIEHFGLTTPPQTYTYPHATPANSPSHSDGHQHAQQPSDPALALTFPNTTTTATAHASVSLIFP